MSNLALFTPLMRQTVGFDRFNDLFETMLNENEERFDTYPPYNIEKKTEDEYRITLAVAGFGEDDLDITVHDDRLIVSGKMENKSEQKDSHYLHRGIATRAFERTFRLADYVQVKNAALADGLLTIDLEREVPEEKKPRMIPIASGSKAKKLIGNK